MMMKTWIGPIEDTIVSLIAPEPPVQFLKMFEKQCDKATVGVAQIGKRFVMKFHHEIYLRVRELEQMKCSIFIRPDDQSLSMKRREFA
jgi:glycyl-tRNA synthetase (class II)